MTSTERVQEQLMQAPVGVLKELKHNGAMKQSSSRKIKSKSKVIKAKNIPTLNIAGWEEVFRGSASEKFQEYLSHHAWRDNLLVQLRAAVRNGEISVAPVTLRKKLLSWLEANCTALCQTVSVDGFRMVYEALRDCLSNVRRDGVKDAYYLRCCAVETLTNVLIKLHVPRHDTRLTKKHVEFLFRMLDGTFVDLVYPEFYPGEGAESKLKRFDHSKEVAARCLLQLEKAYPGFLALEAGSLLQCMLQDTKLKARQDGHPLILLTATVLGNLCSQYQAQQRQRQQQLAKVESVQEGQSIISPTAESEELDSDIAGRSERDHQDSVTTVKDLLLVPKHGRGSESVSDDCGVEGDVGSCTGSEICTSEHFSSDGAGDTSVENKGEEMLAPSGMFLNSSSRSPTRSPTSTAHRVLESSSTREGSVSSDAQSSNWNISVLTRMPLLVDKDSVCPELDRFALSKLLKKFTVPVYVAVEDCLQHPSYYVSEDSKQSLKRAISYFVSRATRSNAETIDVLVSNLPCILESADISPAQVMSIASTLLGYGTSTLLRAVLSIHDQAPKLFGNHGSRKLVDRMFRLINELECPQDQKLDALTWILRLHASQRFNQGDTLYLADCWRELLLRPTDSMQVALLKIKGLSACLAVGIGMEDVVCHNVLLWNGFDQKPTINNKRDVNGGGIGNTNTKLRTMTYAMRLLYHAVETSDLSQITSSSVDVNEARCRRLRACVIVSTMVAIAFKPQLVPAVDGFLDSCETEVSSLFLRAFSALLCGVDGQFEVLREVPEDQEISMLQGISGSSVSTRKGSWTNRVKTAVLARASSLAGQLRGLSFALSFSNRPSSFAVTPVDVNEPPVQNRMMNVKSLRSSILAAMNESSVAQSTHALIQCKDPSFSTHAIQVIQLPSNFENQKAMDAWISDPRTWEPLAPELLKQDLLAYRTLLLRCVSSPCVNSKGPLCALANYAWQYKEAHPSHALASQAAVASVLLAICQKAALTFLPWQTPLGVDVHIDATMVHRDGLTTKTPTYELGWTPKQRAISDLVLSVLDAMDDDGFPVPLIKPRVHSLVSLVTEESQWKTECRGDIFSQLLNDHLQIVVHQVTE